MINDLNMQGVIGLKNQQLKNSLLHSQLKSSPKGNHFDYLFNSALQGQSLSQISRLAMMGGSLSLGDTTGLASASGADSSFLSFILKAAVQQMQAQSPQAAKIAAQPSLPQSASQSDAQTKTVSTAPGGAKTQKAAASGAQSQAGGTDDYDQLILDAAKRHGVDPTLVKAVVTAESDFDPNVVSQAGAQGLMQLMPGTAEDLGVEDVFDPAQNIEGGTKYLSWMLKRFDGDTSKALAAYNWGPANVDKGGSYPAETRNYLKKVTAFQGMYAGGFTTSA